MNTIINKAMIQPIPTDRYRISSTEVIKYLQDQLGFVVDYDFTRWTGISPDNSYIRLRIVIAHDDIVARNTSRDYVDKVLEENAAGIRFKDNVINTLKPFMYPLNMQDIRNKPEQMARFEALGIVGPRLDEIIRYSKLTYHRETNSFGLYLRAERIIADMLTDPNTGVINGDMEILGVFGTTPETFRWEVAVTRNRSGASATGHTGISLDQIFATI